MVKVLKAGKSQEEVSANDLKVSQNSIRSIERCRSKRRSSCS